MTPKTPRAPFDGDGLGLFKPVFSVEGPAGAALAVLHDERPLVLVKANHALATRAAALPMLAQVLQVAPFMRPDLNTTAPPAVRCAVEVRQRCGTSS